MLFYAYISVSRKRNIRRSQNGTKSTGEVVFGRKATEWTWTPRHEPREVPTRVGGAPWARPLPRGAPEAPPTYFLHPYILTYPKTSIIDNRSGVPPPEVSVDTENQSRPVLAPCRRGNLSLVAIFIIPVLSMTRRE